MNDNVIEGRRLRRVLFENVRGLFREYEAALVGILDSLQSRFYVGIPVVKSELESYVIVFISYFVYLVQTFSLISLFIKDVLYKHNLIL